VILRQMFSVGPVPDGPSAVHLVSIYET
jgi:hypothetical protein